MPFPSFPPIPAETQRPPSTEETRVIPTEWFARWLFALMRFLELVIRRAQDNFLLADNRLQVLEKRAKDIYTFLVPGTLVVGTKVTVPLPVGAASTILEAHARVQTAPSGAAIIVDVNRNGNSIWTAAQRLTIPAGQTKATTKVFTVTSLSVDDELSLDIDQVGSTVAGADLAVQIRAG